MNKEISYFLIFTILLFGLISSQNTFAQCGCMSSLSVGTLSPNIGSSSTGTMRQGHLFTNLAGNYIFGDKYWSDWDEVPAQTVKQFENYSIFLLTSLGITNHLTLDMNLGYVLRNYINAPPFEYNRSGLNNLEVLGKYNLYYNPRSDFEITGGLGGKIPLQMVSDTNYKYTQTSQGAFASIYQIFLHKGFKESEIHLFLIHRGELSVKNSADYLYGPYFINSLITTKPISDNFIGLVELKNELKLQDENAGVMNYDSGFMNLILSPQIIFSVSNFTCGIKYELPILRYYHGSQASKNYSLNLNIGYTTKIF
ncbi:MAG: hypothetical protein A2X64_06305 [Ignavibacteria bacterium GWF2_33_9]|nr:MAG: hypothetical protein A2X64_06305 [Ignavibacteria bacterium GWF2_33_9]